MSRRSSTDPASGARPTSRVPLVRRARLAIAIASLALSACHTAYLDRESAGVDFALQGEYAQSGVALAAQVVALGDGTFELVAFEGGLPGAGWNGALPARVAGALDSSGSAARFSGGGTEAVAMAVAGGARLELLTASGRVALARVERASPTLGAPPPSGATIVFGVDPQTGAAVNATNGAIDANGDLRAGATSTAAFGSARIHLEFRTPFMPGARGQLRGNSGVYIQDRYEIQVLDSFGNAPAHDECAAIYRASAPSIAMAFPPLQWQTYDIEFTAARFDDGGAKTAPARVRVLHNGVRVHDDVSLTGPTGLGEREGREPGPITLQDHWNPVVFRNVWVVPLDEPESSAPGLD